MLEMSDISGVTTLQPIAASVQSTAITARCVLRVDQDQLVPTVTRDEAIVHASVDLVADCEDAIIGENVNYHAAGMLTTGPQCGIPFPPVNGT